METRSTYTEVSDASPILSWQFSISKRKNGISQLKKNLDNVIFYLSKIIPQFQSPVIVSPHTKEKGTFMEANPQTL